MHSARDRKGQIVRLRDLDGQGPDKVTHLVGIPSTLLNPETIETKQKSSI